jgi:F0F1-type ATP synthase assembly protein I
MDAKHDRGARGGMIGDWSASGDFFGAILAGLLLGLVGDWVLGTDPWLVVIGIVAGFAVGFWRMYAFAKKTEEDALRQREQRPHP